MTVRRIVGNIAASDIRAGKRFYQDVLGLELLMDHGWIAILGSQQQMTVQISVATEGGSGTSVPDLSIEVDDAYAALRAMKAAGFPIEYGPVDEPWESAASMCAIPSASSSTFLPIAMRREARGLQRQWCQWQAFRASAVAGGSRP